MAEWSIYWVALVLAVTLCGVGYALGIILDRPEWAGLCGLAGVSVSLVAVISLSVMTL